MDNRLLAESILKEVGGKENIINAENCMTRLRLTLQDPTKANEKSVKLLEGVLGVVQQRGEWQIILGPGKAKKVTDEVKLLVGSDQVATSQKAALKERQSNLFWSGFFKRFANIFIPIIPAFIGCGLLQGVVSIIKNIDPSWSHTTLGMVLALLGQNLYLYGLNLFVGYHTAKEFQGTPILGGILATVISTPALSQVVINGAPLTPGRGGVIAVLILVILMSWVERKIRKIIPDSIELFVVPTTVILLGGLFAIYVIQPFGGAVAEGIAWLFLTLIHHGGIFAGFIMGGTFLPLVMLGVHQGLIPIHVQLLQTLGSNPLFPILAMAGGGQVGSAIAVYFKTDKIKLKRVIKAAVPVGILGIGEPLIYGVTLPLRRSFIAACLGGAFGGATIVGLHVATTSFAISGILGVLIATKPIGYLCGLFAAYLFGFIFTWIMGFDDSIYDEVRKGEND